MNPSKRLLGPVLLLAFLCYLIFFHGLGHYALWDPDEGRIGVIAKEMAASGNWMTLTQNGVPYYDKPVPYFWLVALCLKLLGLSELAVRLPSALAASLTVGFVFIWGTVSGGVSRGVWSGMILASSMEFIFLGRLGKMDMVFAFFFTAALLSFLCWRERGGGSLWPFYLFVGLASLAKGPVGVLLPVLIVGIATAIEKRWELFREMRLVRGAGVVLLISVPWYLMAGLRDPEYIWTFLWDHNILRFFALEKGINHPEPIYFFIPVLLAGFLPWSFLLPPILHSLWERRRDKGKEQRLFLIVWAATVLLFFSLSRNKLGTYILPLFPPLALLTADAVSRFVAGEETRRWRQRWILYGSLFWLFLFLTMPLLSERIFAARYPQYLPLNMPLLFSSLFFVAALLGWALRKERRIPWIVLLSALWLTLWFYGDKVNDISELRSTRSLAQVIKESAVKDYRVVAIRSESLPFYLSDRVHVVPHPGVVERLLQEPTPTVALVKERHLGEINGLVPSKIFVWKTIPSGDALIANFPLLAAQNLGSALKR
ncbi:MAG: glycosyltransferase family 39 protein [Deltaproteobacteria bacterium]|nr:glycosyltransferase family 39 protein [Deltaproteobacteria bacterium]